MLLPYTRTIDTLNLKNKFLISLPNISDNRFFKTIIYIVRHDADGAEGLVINKPSAYTFINLISSINNLKIEKSSLPNNVKDIRVLRGGPVNNDKIFILHSNDYSNPQTSKIDSSIFYTKNIDIIKSIIAGKSPKQLSVFIGNCTWEANQLEEEIKNDTWLVYENKNDFIFNKEIENLWQSVYESLGIYSTNSSYFSSGEKSTLQ